MEVKKWNEGSLFIIKDKLVWIYVTLASFVLYVYTLSPGVTWGDSAKLVNYVIKKKFTSDFVGGHNLHTLFGIFFNLLPLHDIAYKQNLMSAFFAALTLGIFYIVSEKVIKSKLSALAAIISLAVSQMFWLLAVINESYSMTFFFFILLLLLMIKYKENHKPAYLFLFTMLFGLSIFENMLITIFLPSYLFYFLSIDKSIVIEKRKLIAIIIGATVGFILPLVILKTYTSIYVSNSSSFIEGVIGAAKEYFRSFHHMVKQLILYPAFLFYQFPLLGFFFGILGFYKSFKADKILFYTLCIGFVTDVMFAAIYMTQRAFNLMVPSFIIFSFFIGYGVKWVNEHRKFMGINIVKIIMLILLFFTPILFYDAVSTYILHQPDKMIVHARELPYRNNIKYYLLPWKQNNHGPEQFAQQIFSVLPANAILIADFTPEDVLRYYQLANSFRTDVKIMDEDHYIFMGKDGGNALSNFIASELKSGKPVFLADNNQEYYFIPQLKRVYSIEKVGIAYKIANKAE